MCVWQRGSRSIHGWRACAPSGRARKKKIQSCALTNAQTKSRTLKRNRRTHAPTLAHGTHPDTKLSLSHTHTHARTHARILTHSHTATHTRKHIRTLARTHARTHSRAHTHARTHTHAHACTHAHTHTRTNARTHAHSSDPASTSPSSPSRQSYRCLGLPDTHTNIRTHAHMRTLATHTNPLHTHNHDARSTKLANACARTRKSRPRTQHTPNRRTFSKSCLSDLPACLPVCLPISVPACLPD